MDAIRELLGRLAELNATELAGLQAQIGARAEELAGGSLTPDVVAELNELDTASESVAARGTELEQVAADGAAVLERLRARTAAPAETPAAETPAAETPAAETPAEETPEAVAAAAAPGAAAMRNAAGTPAGGAQTTERPRLEATNALVASVDSGGQVISDRGELASVFDRRRRQLKGGASGDGEKVVVASVQVEVPESRQLTDSAQTNARLIREATERQSIVAAGGLCAPLDNLYDVPVIGAQGRPLRDALVNFQAPRGGINYRPAVDYRGNTEAIGDWSMDDDAAVGTAEEVEKPCMEVWCNDTDTAVVEAITTCLTFHNVAARFDPETTAANIEATQIAHDAHAERKLLNGMAGFSKTLTSPKVLGATRDVLVLADKLLAYYRDVHRTEEGVNVRMGAPRFLVDMIRSDVARSLGSAYDREALAIAQAEVTGWFTRRNVTPVWYWDGRDAQVAASPLPAVPAQHYSLAANGAVVPEYPDALELFFWVEGDLLHLDGGSLDLGVVRDSTLNATNEYKSFSETWEGLAFRGLELLRVIQAVDPTGGIAGTVDTSAISD